MIIFLLLHGFTLSTWLVFLSFPPPRHIRHHFIYLTPSYSCFPHFPSPLFCFLLPHVLHSSSPICSFPPSFFCLISFTSFQHFSSYLPHFHAFMFPSKTTSPSLFHFLAASSNHSFLSFIHVSSVLPFPSSLPFLKGFFPFLSLHSPCTPHSLIIHFTSSTPLPVYVPSSLSFSASPPFQTVHTSLSLPHTLFFCFFMFPFCFLFFSLRFLSWFLHYFHHFAGPHPPSSIFNPLFHLFIHPALPLFPHLSLHGLLGPLMFLLHSSVSFCLASSSLLCSFPILFYASSPFLPLHFPFPFPLIFPSSLPSLLISSHSPLLFSHSFIVFSCPIFSFFLSFFLHSSLFPHPSLCMCFSSSFPP